MGIDGLVKPAHMRFVGGDVVGGEEIDQPFGFLDYPVILLQAFSKIIVVGKNVAEDTIAAHILFALVGIEFDQALEVTDFPVSQAQVVPGDGPASSEWIGHGAHYTHCAGKLLSSATQHTQNRISNWLKPV